MIRVATSTNKCDGILWTLSHRIAFRYWGFSSDLTDALKSQLQLAAEERAREMIFEGCHSGDLCFYCNDTGEEIRGWWEIED